MLSARKSRYVLLTALFSVFAVTPLLKPEFFASHDMLAPVYRLIVLNIPEGRHKILLKFEDTPVRRASEILSLFAFITMGLAVVLQTVRAYRAASGCTGR